MIGRLAVLVFAALIGGAQAQNISGGGSALPSPVIEGGCIIGVGGAPAWGSCSGSGTPVVSVTGTAGKIQATPTSGAVVLTFPAKVEVYASDYITPVINYIVPNSVFSVLGNATQPYALAGGAKASNQAPGAASSHIGVSGIGIADQSGGYSATWGGYFETRVASGSHVSGQNQAVEMEISNSSAVDGAFVTPANVKTAAPRMSGLIVAAGGGLSPGAHPVSAALLISDNTQQFTSGIVFDKAAIVGADGTVGGSAPAISLGLGHNIVWYNTSGAATGAISGNNATAANRQVLQFGDNVTFLSGANEANLTFLDGGAGKNQRITFSDGATAKFAIVKDTGNNLGIFDSVLGAYVTKWPAGIGGMTVGPAIGTTLAGDVNISGDFKKNGVVLTGGGGSTTITLSPGFASTIGTQNTGAQTLTTGTTLTRQLWPVDKSLSYQVAAADTGNKLISTGAAVTFTLPNPAAGTKGTPFQFGSDGSQGFTLTTVAGTALVYGCSGAGTTSVAFAANIDVDVVDTGTAYKCSEIGGTSGGGGSGTVNAGTGPSIAQYPSGTGTIITPVTISGDIALAQGGAATIQPGVVTNAKMATAGANTIKGNFTGSTAALSDNALPDCPDTGSNHLVRAAGAGFACSVAIPTIPTTSLSGTLQASQFPALTGPVTTTAGSLATTIATNGITNAMIRQGLARSVIGVTGNATANVADIQGTANQVFVINSAGTALAFGQVNLASSSAVTGTIMAGSFPALTGPVTTTAGSFATSVTNNAITNAMLRQGIARSVVGVTGNGTANVADIQGAANQVFRVPAAGDALAFGAVNLGAAAAITGYDTSLLSVTTGSLTAKECVALTDGITITVDLAQSHCLTITETVAGRAYANPTNGHVGDTYLFIRGASGSGITPTFGSAWRFQGGNAPVLSSSTAEDMFGCLLAEKSGSNVTKFNCNVIGLNYTGGFSPSSLSNVQVILDPSDHTTKFTNGTCTSSTVAVTDGLPVGSIRDKSPNGSCWVATGGTITQHTDGNGHWWLVNDGASSLVSATGTGANPNTIGQNKAVIAAVMGVQYTSNVANKIMLNVRTNGNNPRFVCGLNTAGGTAAGPSLTARQLDADTTATVSAGTATGYTGVPLAHECNATYDVGHIYTWSNNGTVFASFGVFGGGNTSNTTSVPSPSALGTGVATDRLYYLVLWTPATDPGNEQAQVGSYVCQKMGTTC